MKRGIWAFLAVLAGVGAAVFLFQSSPVRVDDEAVPSNLLVRIGDRTITVDEFIRRAEYTVRPRYCQGNSGLDKKIVLNSLIGEKLLALEAGDTNRLFANEHYRRYLEGRKEQAMREILWETEGKGKVVLDSSEIRARALLAGRTYSLEYFSVADEGVAADLAARLAAKTVDFKEAFRSAGGRDSIPAKSVGWEDAGGMREALFSRPLQIGEVVIPDMAGDSVQLFVRVKGWTTRVAVRAEDEHWNDVVEDLSQRQAGRHYDAFASNVMRGKRMEFDREGFRSVGRMLAPLYFAPGSKKGDAFLQGSFGKRPGPQAPEDLERGFLELRDMPLFRLNDREWTVGDFQVEFERHPLVFRKKRFTTAEYPEQLKLAIADMVRDRHLTNVAYDRGYDRHPAVMRYVSLWKDADAALYWKQVLLRDAHRGDAEGLGLLTAHIDSLQGKYGSSVEINTEAFNSLKLTRVSALAIQRNVPFPVYVPSFPIITSDHTLDYGRDLEVTGERKTG